MASLEAHEAGVSLFHAMSSLQRVTISLATVVWYSPLLARTLARARIGTVLS